MVIHLCTRQCVVGRVRITENKKIIIVHIYIYTIKFFILYEENGISELIFIFNGSI